MDFQLKIYPLSFNLPRAYKIGLILNAGLKSGDGDFCALACWMLTDSKQPDLIAHWVGRKLKNYEGLQ